MGQQKRFLIAGTGERVGKTTVGCALGFAMRARGMRVGVMKAVDTPESQDAQALALAVGSILPMEVICPYRDGADSAPELTHIARCFDEIAAGSDAVLVESSELIDFAELAETLKLEVVVVVGNRQGCVEAAMRVLERCENRGLKVAGYIVCDSEPIAEINEESLPQIVKARWLGRMRHREPLARSIVEKLILD